MFDSVTCNYPLPDGFIPEGLVFQTHDLDEGYSEFRIDADGRLMVERADWVKLDDHDRAVLRRDAGLPPSKLPFPVMRKSSSTWELFPFSGQIALYWSNISSAGPNGVATDDDAPICVREYKINFRNGEIVDVSGGIQDSSDRKQISRAEMQATFAALAAFHNRPLGRIAGCAELMCRRVARLLDRCALFFGGVQRRKPGT